MAEPKKPAKSKAINDVAHPGKSAPSDTSKAIITHRPIMKDPMVVEDSADKPESETKQPLSKRAGEVKLKPASQPAVEAEADTDESVAGSSSTNTDKAAQPADSDKKSKQPDAGTEAAAQAEQDTKLQKIIDSKKYALPINAVEQRRSKRFVVLGIILAVILALAWGDIAADAGLIHVKGIKPVTHFFSN
jgi:cell envelope opacity-associated protein A